MRPREEGTPETGCIQLPLPLKINTLIAKPTVATGQAWPPLPMNWAFLYIRESSFEMKEKDFCSLDWFRAAPFPKLHGAPIRLLLTALNHLNAGPGRMGGGRGGLFFRA